VKPGLAQPSFSPAAWLQVSATIHLANKDWDALIDDFIALGFLPRDADRYVWVGQMV
jgi:hypothetical protein